VGLLVSAATLLGLALHQLSPAGAVRATTLSGVGLALVLGSITLQRNTVWTNALTLWSDTVAKSPGKARPHLLLGEALVRAGRRTEAERELRRAVDIDPGYPAGRTSLATFLQRSGRSAEAESQYREVLRLDPDHLAAVFNMADILWSTGRRDEASRLYRRYLELAPTGDRAGRSIAAARTGEAPQPGASPTLPR
jgi:cytochrome c-type biogenesis protein CcmH/NrfG